MQQYFTENTYTTPANRRRYIIDRLMFGGRWWFYFLYIKTIFKYRPLALQGKYDDETWAESSIKMHRVVEHCGGKIHIDGLEHLRAESEPVVIVGNHMSTAESQLLPGIIEPIKHVTFVVKQSLMTGPIWGPIMRARDPIVVTRVDPRKDMQEVLTRGVEHIKAGRSICIFPQATRSVKFDPEVFNSLGIKLAKKAGVKIMPVALKTDFWGNGKIMKAFGPISRKKPLHFSFGPAQAVEGNTKELHQGIIDFIYSHLKKWGHTPL